MAFFAAGCKSFSNHQISGDGPLQTRPVEISQFQSLSVTSGINVDFTAVPAGEKPSATLSAPSTLMPYVIVKVDKGVLHVTMEDNNSYRNTGSIRLTLSAPMVNNISATSGSDIDITAASPVGELTLQATSGADIDIPSLKCTTLTAQSTSGADIDVSNLSATSVVLQATSGADIDVKCAAVETLSASATSGASIDIAGTVENLSANATSAASIDAKEIQKATLRTKSTSTSSSGSVSL